MIAQPTDARGFSPRPSGSYSRPGEIQPWLAAGVSRATWYRRNKPPAPMRLITGPRWYVLSTFQGQIGLADRALREAGFEVFSPTVFKPATLPRRDAAGHMRPGKPDRVEFIFVRYIVVRFDASDPSWRRALECDGIERVIRDGAGVPIPVPEAQVARVRELLGPNDCLDAREKPIAAGTRVHLRGGPLPDVAGVCAMSDGQRVLMLMGMFNRDNVRATVRQSSVEAA